MAEPSQLTQHIESFVNLSTSSTHQVHLGVLLDRRKRFQVSRSSFETIMQCLVEAASLDAIFSLLKSNALTIETLVREMGMYLTTTDDVIRARGILLLGELLTRLESKPLDDATVHSLITFFTDRLADWKALRGALVGCLALVRKSSGGMVAANDAKAVAQSYIQNLQVQSLAQHDRKLCFELLDCLLQRYPDAVASLGEDFLYGICEAIDGEKDPHCLMLTFHIIEVVAQLFPVDMLASFVGDLFEILGCYFPIHFTHPKGEDFDVKRDDLSRALMVAFSSTPLFEPFVIPLLLEKLSSSLQSAKVDSLKYLSNCTMKYGADRMAKHARAMWSSIKDAIYTSNGPDLSFTTESLDGVVVEENGILTEALKLLETVIKQNNGLFLSGIIGDEDINWIFKSISSFKIYNEIPLQSKQKLHAVGCILSLSAKASLASCNSIMESFFPCLMDALGLSVGNSSKDCSPNDNYVLERRLNHGALYLCIELIAACRDFIAGSEEFKSESTPANETSYLLLQSFSASLTKALSYTLATSTNGDAYGADIYFGVKGLLILGTFHEGSSIISKSIFENILLTFTSIITMEFEKTLLWKLGLKALVHIGSFIDRFSESEKALSYMCIVIEQIVSLTSSYEFSVPFPLKLEAISEIGASGPNYLLKTVQGLEDAICANLSEVFEDDGSAALCHLRCCLLLKFRHVYVPYSTSSITKVHGNPKSAEIVVQLLECYSNKMLPRIHETGGSEEVFLRFALNIWNLIENCVAFSSQIHEKGLLNATMKAMKLAVGSCSVESQNIIIEKAYTVLSLSNSFLLKESASDIPIQLKGLQLTQETGICCSRAAWIYSLFASVIIAVHPQTRIPNVRLVIHLFITTLLEGNVPSAQALGSMVNKLGLKSNGTEIPNTCTLEEAMDIIFNMNIWSYDDNGTLRGSSGMDNASAMGFTDICHGAANIRSLQIHAIAGLAWIGKGLLMRGHEKVKDITMVILECLLSNGRKGSINVEQNNAEHSPDSVMKCAADSFQILMSDSEDCLSRKFHATIRPLYKQRFYSTMMPILQPLIAKSESPFSRSILCRACAHIISDTPLIVVLNDAKKLIPILMDGLSVLSNDVLDKDIMYSLLLILSGILIDKNGQEVVIECAHIIINRLIQLTGYPHMMLVRETAIQCLVAMSRLPHARIYPMRRQVLQAISKALDDPKRAVRQEAVRCRQAWASIATRSLHF